MLKSHIEKSSEDHIYYNLSLFNNTTKDIPAIFQETRSQPILLNPEEYNIAVARLGIPSNDIPFFAFEDNTYYVTLTYLGVDYQQVLIKVAKEAAAYTTSNIYAIENFLESVNNALSAAYTALVAAHAGVVDHAPFMIYDSTTGLFTLVFDPKYQSAPVEIWFNTELYLKFESFYVFFNGYFNASKKDFRFFTIYTGNNVVSYPVVGTTTPNINWLSNVQESPNVGNLFNIVSIVVTTNLLPVMSESIAISGLSTAGGSTNGNASQLNILTDFEPQVGNQLSTPVQAQRLQYQPSLYRLIPLQSNRPLRSIDLQIYSQTRDGELQQIFIGPQRGMNIKILFLKKGLYA